MSMRISGVRWPRAVPRSLRAPRLLAVLGHAQVIPRELGQLPRAQPWRLAARLPRPRQAATRWQTLSLPQRIAGGLLVLAIAYRVALALRGWPALDSDEAITGLVARHILLFGDRPVFFWGEHYMGALQAYLAVPLFAVFGSSVLALHLSLLVLVSGFLATMYLLGRAAYGEMVGLLVLAWLTFGPSIATLRELTASGGYQDILFFGALVLLGVWTRLRRPEQAVESRRALATRLTTYAAIGFCAGVGLWSDLLILPLLLAAAATLLVARWRELWRCGAVALILAFLFSGFPYLHFNFDNPGSSYREAVTISNQSTSAPAPPSLDRWRAQVGETLSVAVPVLLGSPHVCVNSGAIWHNYPTSQAHYQTQGGGFCDAANTAFSLTVGAIYLLVALQLLAIVRGWLVLAVARFSAGAADGWRAARTPGSRLAFSRARLRAVARQTTLVPEVTPAEAEASARLWLRGMLLGVAALTLLAYVSSVNAALNEFTSVRYLVPLYLTAPLLFGELWRHAGPLLRALTARAFPRFMPVKGSQVFAMLRTPRRVAAAGALLALLALSLAGGTQTLARASQADQFALPSSPADQHLVAFLGARHVTAFYGDYWVCYRLLFETNERLSCAVRGQNGEHGLALVNNRYAPFVQTLAAVRYPAYILPAATTEDKDFVGEAKEQHLPYQGYQREVVGTYAVYYHAP